jgi:hypothetical protein
MEYTAGQNRVADRPRSFYLAMAAVLGGILLCSRFLEPPRFINVCLFKMVTGLPCMTCGLTRAFHAISLGHLQEALAYHPLSPFLYGLTVFHFLVACLRLLGLGFRLIRPSSRRAPNPVRAMACGTLGLLVVFWIPRLLASVLQR